MKKKSKAEKFYFWFGLLKEVRHSVNIGGKGLNIHCPGIIVRFKK